MPNEKCIITKPRKEMTSASRMMGVSIDVYEEIQNLATESGRGIRYVADKLLRFALEHVEIIDE